MADISDILSRIDADDPTSAEQLLPLVYAELRKVAAAKLATEKPGQTLTATALVHEAYLRLVGGAVHQQWNGRRHFFAAAAEAMRRILVENARRKKSLKHGGKLRRQDANLDRLIRPDTSEDILQVDEALQSLQQVNFQAAKIVELRYFAGLTIDEAASIMDISDRTARRCWTYAKAWLREAIDRNQET
jgi:RNA polymerase sigma factor (TIGR02999 family)